MSLSPGPYSGPCSPNDAGHYVSTPKQNSTNTDSAGPPYVHKAKSATSATTKGTTPHSESTSYSPRPGLCHRHNPSQRHANGPLRRCQALHPVGHTSSCPAQNSHIQCIDTWGAKYTQFAQECRRDEDIFILRWEIKRG